MSAVMYTIHLMLNGSSDYPINIINFIGMDILQNHLHGNILIFIALGVFKSLAVDQLVLDKIQ